MEGKLLRVGGSIAVLSFLGLWRTMASKSAEPWETGNAPSLVLAAPLWPKEFPLTANHLKRLDEHDDGVFYSQPRIVHHVRASLKRACPSATHCCVLSLLLQIDEHAIATLKAHYKEVLPRDGVVLDLMSSWTSHLEHGAGQDKADGYFGRVSAIGMNADELGKNPALHDWHVADLNLAPALPMYADASFDAVICSVSVDYLAHPLEVFTELRRVLKPGGVAVFTWSNRCDGCPPLLLCACGVLLRIMPALIHCLSFSHSSPSLRMFPTKAIRAWREASEPARLWICGAYFHYTGGWTAPVGVDISPYPGRTDPVYAVSARKLPAPTQPAAESSSQAVDSRDEL